MSSPRDVSSVSGDDPAPRDVHDVNGYPARPQTRVNRHRHRGRGRAERSFVWVDRGCCAFSPLTVVGQRAYHRGLPRAVEADEDDREVRHGRRGRGHRGRGRGHGRGRLLLRRRGRVSRLNINLLVNPGRRFRRCVRPRRRCHGRPPGPLAAPRRAPSLLPPRRQVQSAVRAVFRGRLTGASPHRGARRSDTGCSHRARSPPPR